MDHGNVDLKASIEPTLMQHRTEPAHWKPWHTWYIPAARNLRTSVGYRRNGKGASETYNSHNQTDNVEFLEMRQFQVR